MRSIVGHCHYRCPPPPIAALMAPIAPPLPSFPPRCPHSPSVAPIDPPLAAALIQWEYLPPSQGPSIL
ncbi:unnamed protein product [Closterium sp. NIES-53]